MPVPAVATVASLAGVTSAWGNSVAAACNMYEQGAIGSRPAAGAPGRQYFDTGNNRLYIDDGTGWTIVSEPAQSWTPAISGITYGLGATVAGYYKRGDGWVDISASILLGSSGSSVSSSATLTLPIAASFVRRGQLQVTFTDTGVATYFGTTDAGSTGTTLYAILTNSTWAGPGLVSTSNPFTWGAGDQIEISGRYQMTTRYS